MSATPMKIGMYHFARMMTSKSTPAVVTISPGRIHVATADQVLLDAAPGEVQLKMSKLSGAITLLAPAGKVILAGVGSASAAPHSPQQEEEIRAAQQTVSQDPQVSHIALSQLLWAGRTTNVDGSYQGGLKSLLDGDAAAQKRIGQTVRDAMFAAGVQPA